MHQVQQHAPVALTAEQAGIPGLQLHTDFITPEQEAALLQQIDQQPWQQLSKRRVQHYGYCFDYSQRGVDAQQRIGPLPQWMQPLVQQMEVGSSGAEKFTV
jgi:alkylated DNA repair protein alkB family protein 8